MAENNKRKWTLADWSLLLSLISFGGMLFVMLMSHSIGNAISRSDSIFLALLGSLLFIPTFVFWITAPISALVSFIIALKMMTKEEHTWKLLLAIVFSIAGFCGAFYMLKEMM